MLTLRWIPRISTKALLIASSANISELIPEQSDHTRNLHSVMDGILGRRPCCNNMCTKCSAHAGCSGNGPGPAWAHSGCTMGWSAEEVRSSYCTGRTGRFFTPVAGVAEDGRFFMAHAPACKDEDGRFFMAHAPDMHEPGCSAALRGSGSDYPELNLSHRRPSPLRVNTFVSTPDSAKAYTLAEHH